MLGFVCNHAELNQQLRFFKEKVCLVCWSWTVWSFPELPCYRRSADFLTG